MDARFIEQTNERRLPSDYAGDVLVWDIDKTYLNTRFSSAKGLLRIPFELAQDKATVPGAIPLLRALRRGAGEESALVPLYFVSGSPPQVRGTVERKMLLDGVDYDGITFKDQLGLVLAGKFRYIYEQVGYKLRALLMYRRELPGDCRHLLFGDDTEADAEAFALFGEVCAGLRGASLDARLPAKVEAWEREEIHRLLEDLAVEADNPVDGIFIHLARRSDPSRFADPRVFPTRSYLQTALLLAARGKIHPAAIGGVVKAMRRRLVPERAIEEQLADAGARFDIPPELLHEARGPRLTR